MAVLPKCMVSILAEKMRSAATCVTQPLAGDLTAQCTAHCAMCSLMSYSCATRESVPQQQHLPQPWLAKLLDCIHQVSSRLPAGGLLALSKCCLGLHSLLQATPSAGKASRPGANKSPCPALQTGTCTSPAESDCATAAVRDAWQKRRCRYSAALSCAITEAQQRRAAPGAVLAVLALSKCFASPG